MAVQNVYVLAPTQSVLDQLAIIDLIMATSVSEVEVLVRQKDGTLPFRTTRKFTDKELAMMNISRAA